MDGAAVGAAALHLRELERDPALLRRADEQLLQTLVGDHRGVIREDGGPEPHLRRRLVGLDAGDISRDVHFKGDADVRLHDVRGRSRTPQADLLLDGRCSDDGIGMADVLLLQAANDLCGDKRTRPVVEGLAARQAGGTGRLLFSPALGLSVHVLFYRRERGIGHHGVPDADPHVLRFLFIGAADVHEHLVSSDHLGPLLGRQDVGRLGGDDAEHHPPGAADLHALAEQDLVEPSTDRVEREKSESIDTGNDEPYLVHVAGQEDDRPADLAPCAEMKRAQLVAADLISEWRDVALHQENRVPLEPRRAEAFAQAFQEFKRLIVHGTIRIDFRPKPCQGEGMTVCRSSDGKAVLRATGNVRVRRRGHPRRAASGRQVRGRAGPHLLLPGRRRPALRPRHPGRGAGPGRARPLQRLRRLPRAP